MVLHVAEKEKQEPVDNLADNTPSFYKRHVQGAVIRSAASIFMWCCGWIAYLVGIIRLDNFTGISFVVLFLAVYNLPALLVLKRTPGKRLRNFFSLLINLLEIICYTAIMHFLGGIEALYLIPVYAILIFYLGIVANGKYPFLIAVFCIICFSAMVSLEYLGLLRSYKLHPTFQWPWINQIMIMLANATMLVAIAFVAYYTGTLLKKNRDNLYRQYLDLKVAHQRASESDRLKSEFLANMSHELRTPLNAIIGFSELLGYDYPQKLRESQNEYVKNINTSGKHLLAIISDILDLSKLEAGKLQFDPIDVLLPELLQNSILMFKETTLKRRIQMKTDFTGCPETIKADELRLKQVIYNLLSNALKFTPEGGNVTLAARRLIKENHHWVTENGLVVFLPAPVGYDRIDYNCIVDISVADTGVGVKKEDQKRIFSPFEQVDGSIRRRHEGTGLGLSLAKRFIELHGGFICVESEGKNKGSTFHCIIPIN